MDKKVLDQALRIRDAFDRAATQLRDEGIEAERIAMTMVVAGAKTLVQIRGRAGAVDALKIAILAIESEVDGAAN